MALLTAWSSTARLVSLLASLPAAQQERVGDDELEALFAAWEASRDKGAFMDGISSVQAAALCDVIYERVPPTNPEPRTANYGMSDRQRAARKRRIGELLSAEAGERIVSNVYAVLASEHGACPAPDDITTEMVAGALARLGRKAAQ